MKAGPVHRQPSQYFLRSRPFTPFGQESCRRQEVPRIGRRGWFRQDQLRQVDRQGRQGDDVQAVVPEDVPQKPAVPCPEPAEVPFRDLASREVVFPEQPQEGRLQGPEPAVLQAPPHEAAARVEQVQVGKGFQGVREAVHDEPGGQEVDVEGLAVEGDEGLPR